MTTSRRVLIALSLSAALAGCSKSATTETPGSGAIVGITASRRAVVANGLNSVTLTVTDTSGGPVTLTTSRGTFAGGGAVTTLAGASSTLDLITCDASSASSCAGNALVTASHGSATASVSITFGALATVCSADCAADAGCPNRACVPTGGGNGTCSSTTPSTCVATASCTPTEQAETTCSGGVDEDCDGDVDCADSDCNGQACDPGSPTFLCQASACTDTSTGLAVQVTPARKRLPANGAATTTVAVKVTSGSSPAGAVAIDVSTDLGTFGGSAGASGTTGEDGIATFTYTASATPGVATITANIHGVTAISGRATVAMPALGELTAEAPQYRVLGARGSGYQELGHVSVLAKDEAGEPYPDGLAVRFEHRRLGGSTLGAPLAADTATCVAASGCVGYLGATSSGSGPADTVGQATAWLYSGTIAGTLVTTASATAGGVTRTIALPTVAVVGARASGANFSVVCNPRNVPAYAETTCSVSLVDAPFQCEALIKDRYDNVLGTATQVIFMSEASAIGKVVTTPAYDPDAAPPADLGIATQTFFTLGAGLPLDVAPLGGEPSVDLGAPDACGIQVHNPRDGVVTVIAVADGEEAFFDTNGNGVYDAGEPFVDQGEPFVDANDDGAFQPGEWFLDVDGDAAYTDRNGVWDAATKIWTQTVVVYSGQPATLATGAGFLGMRWSDTAPGACIPTAAPTPFAVHADRAGPPAVPASSQAYFVYASDQNLNRLVADTNHSVSVATGTVSATFRGLQRYADDLGMFYRYWPCDQTSPTPACASQCRPGMALPCVMRPSLSAFECGVGAAVLITGGSSADAGVDEVDWNVSTPYEVYGSARTFLGVRAITGTNDP